MMPTLSNLRETAQEKTRAALDAYEDDAELRDNVQELLFSVALTVGFAVQRRALRKRGAPEWAVYSVPRVTSLLSLINYRLQKQNERSQKPQGLML